eukprot:gene17906-21698_t
MPGVPEPAAAGGRDVQYQSAGSGDEGIGQGRYKLSRSAWDAAVLCWMPRVEGWASVVLVCVPFFVAVTQALCIAFLFADAMSWLDITHRLPRSLLEWRKAVGHDLAQSDANHVSLVDRVCAADPSLHLAQRQASDLLNIRTCLDQHLSIFVLLPLSILFTSISAELTQAWEFGAAWGRLPAAVRPGAECRAGANERMTITHAPTARRVLAVCIAACRAVIAGCLGVTGAVSVCTALRAEKQMLSSVGVVFVLDIDELAFRAFAPAMVPGMITDLSLLSVPLGHRMARFRTLGGFAVFAAALAATQSLLVSPIHGSLLAAEDALCGGDRGFTMSRYPGTGVPIWAPSTGYVEGQAIGSPYADAVAQRLLPRADSPRPAYSVRPVTPFDELQRSHQAESFSYTRPEALQLERQGLETMTKVQPCWDGLWGGGLAQKGQPLAFLKAIRRAARNRTLCARLDDLALWGGVDREQLARYSECCAEARSMSQSLCRAANSSTIRSLCPVTCGCGAADAKLYRHTAAEGCPPQCAAEWGELLGREGALAPAARFDGCADGRGCVAAWAWDTAGGPDAARVLQAGTAHFPSGLRDTGWARKPGRWGATLCCWSATCTWARSLVSDGKNAGGWWRRGGEAQCTDVPCGEWAADPDSVRFLRDLWADLAAHLDRRWRQFAEAMLPLLAPNSSWGIFAAAVVRRGACDAAPHVVLAAVRAFTQIMYLGAAPTDARLAAVARVGCGVVTVASAGPVGRALEGPQSRVELRDGGNVACRTTAGAARVLRRWCPVACGCRRGMRYCPAACPCGERQQGAVR